MLRKKDFWWLLATPFYLVFGTARHEASHALAALLQGAGIVDASIFPTALGDLLPPWGRVWYSQPCGWVAAAAPYFCDLLTFGLTLLLLLRCRIKRRWLWLNVVIIGIISPFVNSLHNYAAHYWRHTDVSELVGDLPDLPVHLYFWVTLVAYAAGLLVVLRRRDEGEVAAALPAGVVRYGASGLWCGFFGLVIVAGLLLVFHPALGPRLSVQEVRRKLEESADPNLVVQGKTGLQWAVSSQDVAMARGLLARGADVGKSSSNRAPPLHMAAWQGDEDMISLLLEHGADANSTWDGRTVLADALIWGHSSALDLLLSHGAHLLPEGSLPDLAARGDMEGIRRLLNEGVPVDSTVDADLTALHCAAVRGHADIVALLLATGAEPSARAFVERSPLHLVLCQSTSDG